MADADNMLDARGASEMGHENRSAEGKWIKGARYMDWGLRNRLSRLIRPDGHCQFLPVDHGYFQGPTRCLERPGETVKDLLDYSDGLFVTRGVLRSAIDPDTHVPIILRVSGGTSVIGKDLANEIITTTIEEVIRVIQK